MKSKVLILGSTGLVGSNLLKKYGEKYPGSNIFSPRSFEVNLCDWRKTTEYIFSIKPDLVFLCAAKVGGIKANNDYKADFITENLKIQTNVIEACHLSGVKKLVFLGSSCIYPKECPQPIKEEYLLTGPLELTNDAYAVAKIAGIKMCQSYNQQYGSDFISVMPSNLYGPGDNFDLNSSHVLPALIRKFHEAKILGSSSVEIWGTGRPRREFLHVEDLAEALIFLSENYTGPEIINVGTGEDLTILELAKMIKSVVNYKGEIVFNSSYPDGTMRKVLDVSKIENMGWSPKISLREGIKTTYEFYKERYENSNNYRN
jgi:GDP-L-fucose synthase